LLEGMVAILSGDFVSRVKPQSDIRLAVLGRMQKTVCR
jgi:hypothetical protein